MNVHAQTQLVKDFFRSGHSEGTVDSEVLRKIVLINIVSLVGIVILVPMGVLAVVQFNALLACFDLGSAVLLLANLVYLRNSRNVAPASYLGVGIAMLLFWFLVLTGGVDNSAFVWCYTLPLFALFLLGTRVGLLANLVFFVPIMLILMIEPDWPMLATYSYNIKLRFIPSFFVVLGYAYLFELMRATSHSRLRREIRHHQQTERELHQAKRIAESASEAKSRFLANMSHELRTPLNHIIGFTQLVVDKSFGDLNETQDEYLRDVLSSSEHLLALINDVLDLSKVEAGKLELQPSDVELQRVLESSLVMIREKASQNGIELCTQIASMLETLSTDERIIKQVLYNLLSNAVKFTPRGGSITLSARACAIENHTVGASDGRVIRLPKSNNGAGPEKGIHISVTDTGIGLKQQELKRVFNRFEQAGLAVEKDELGTGLGLSLTKKFIQLHGGAIWAESDGADQGSTFSFVIPILA